MLLGNLLLGTRYRAPTTFPLVLGAISIVASIVGTFFVGIGKVQNSRIMNALYFGMGVASVLALIGFCFAANRDVRRGTHRAHTPLAIFVCALVGVLITGRITLDHRILHRHAVSPGPADRQGLGNRPRDEHHRRPRRLDARHCRLPAIVIVIGILVSFASLACTASASRSWRCSRWPESSSRSTRSDRSPTTPAASPKWPRLPEDVRDVTDPLDAVGNTTKAVTKGLRDRFGRPRGRRALCVVLAGADATPVPGCARAVRASNR